LVLAALHELATNALKHGAFKHEDGKLSVAWTVQPETGAVRLDWKEAWSSPVKVSARRGFGRSLIEQALPSQLGAKTKFELTPSGLGCSIEIPAAVTGFTGRS
jgi:two-component system CheB/CheR fusion protein